LLQRRWRIRSRDAFRRRYGLGPRAFRGAAARRAPLSIEMLLVPASLVGSIVPLAPLIGLLATVVLAAAERTAEITPIRVAWMGQKANAAMAAMDRTACQIRMIAQDGIQRQLILTNKRTGAVVLVPIGKKLKEFRDRYRKYARFSVKILRLVFTPSSYSLEANASSGRARIFHAFSRKPRPSGGSIGRRDTNGRPPLSSTPLIMSSRHPMRHRPRARLAAHHQPTQNLPDRRAATWKKNPGAPLAPNDPIPHFFFQVVVPFT